MGGFHTWTVGEVLTAANMNSFVRDQVVSNFATVSARDAAITSPTEGLLAYCADSNETYLYTGSSWQGAIHRQVVKPVDETINNNGTYQDDNDLFLTVEANSSYQFQCQLSITSTAAADIKINFLGPASFSYSGLVQFYERDTAAARTLFYLTNSTSGGVGLDHAGGTVHYANIDGRVVIAGTAGTFKLQWTQLVATAVNTTVGANSFLALRKMI